MRILLIGDIVASPGREAVKKIVPRLRREKSIDFVIANAENVAGGSGLTPETIDELLQNKIDVITSGDHVWKKKELYDRLSKDSRVLRPANYPKTSPGSGMGIFSPASGKKIAVINLLGRVFMDPVDCPFQAAEKEIEKIKSFYPETEAKKIEEDLKKGDLKNQIANRLILRKFFEKVLT